MAERPNILFILSDDQGAWAMGCAGTPELHTPNLDRIAARGVRFDNFFCASPVCSPARASLLTGTIPSAHGVHDWLRSGNVDAERFARQGKENPYGGYEDEDKPIRYLEGMATYTEALARNGYQCALSGKWHLGDSVSPQQGFSRWYTLGKGGCHYYHPDVVEDGDITVMHGSYVTDLITGRALEYLDEFADGEDPFYLSVHYTAPHSPWGREHHPPEFLELYEDCAFSSIPDRPDHPDMTTGPVFGTEARRENLRGYFASITAMDRQIGRLLDRLEERGLEDNTVVIFTSDNGMSMGHHGIWGKGNGTFPLNMFDTAIKVPFLMDWPGLGVPGSVCSSMVSACDLFPTLLDLLDMEGELPPDLPGRSFAPALRGEEEGDRAVFICDEYGPVRMIRTREAKYVRRYPYGPDELYDLVRDPGEETNRIDNPAWAGTVVDLRARLEEWFARYADPTRDGVREEVTGLGQLCSAGTRAEKLVKYARTVAP